MKISTVLRLNLCLCLAAAGSGCLTQPPAGPCSNPTTLHVSPSGHDSANGRTATSPLATLDGARTRVRELRNALGPDAPIRVLLANGLYELDSTLTFGPEDSGSETCPVRYEAAPGAKPILSGGSIVRGLIANNGVWIANVGASWRFDQLYVNGKRATRARWPKAGLLQMRAAAPSSINPITRKPYTTYECVVATPPAGACDQWKAFFGYPNDLAPLVRANPAELANAKLVIYHVWEATQAKLVSIESTGRVNLAAPTFWNIFKEYGDPPRYHYEGLPSLLTDPGEWVLAANGTLSYIPLPGESLSQATVIAPRLEKLLHVDGANHITFSGIAFEHSGFVLPQQGWASLQASVFTGYTQNGVAPAAIQLNNTRNIIFDSVEISHTGNHALSIEGAQSTGNALRNSLLTDLGGGGVYLHHQTTRTAVENNLIASGGHVFPGAVGIWIGRSHENKVSHNDISDFRYSGISVGWEWGYRDQYKAVQNIIEYNHIHHLGWGLLADMGAIYTLGPSWGTVIRNNVIHHLQCSPSGGCNGLYNDAGSAGITWQNNLVHHLGPGGNGYVMTYGKDIKVKNNIFASAGDSAVYRGYRDCFHALDFSNNIVSVNNSIAIQGDYTVYLARPGLDWKGIANPACPTTPVLSTLFEKNLYHSSSSIPLRFASDASCRDTGCEKDLSFAGWKLKTQNDETSFIADPKFVNPGSGDFRFSDPSIPALIGFESFDPSRAGLPGNSPWRPRAELLKAGPPGFPSGIPDTTLPIHEDFESLPVNIKPGKLWPVTLYENNDPSVGPYAGVSTDFAASGTRSLKLIHIEGSPEPYSPMVTFNYQKTNAPVVASFDVRLSPDTTLIHEWRQPIAGYHYRVGPSFGISNLLVTVQGRSVDLRQHAGKWIHFEIRTKTGSLWDGKWHLAVTVDGQTTRLDNLILSTRDAKGNIRPPAPHYPWIGFVSGQKTNTYYLDNIKISGE